jgi:hypothetical protein
MRSLLHGPKLGPTTTRQQNPPSTVDISFPGLLGSSRLVSLKLRLVSLLLVVSLECNPELSVI